jgi:3-hydroxyisobutyrate dehydrogenase
MTGDPDTRSRQPRVGFIGLGNIGAPMAHHLLDWPGGLVVSDVRSEATRPFAEDGATVAVDNAELAAGCGVISLMVLDDAQVRRVAGEVLPAAREGTVMAIHSTIRPETAVAMGELAARHGVQVVDAPVSGGFLGAHEGSLAVMVGGTEEALDAARGPFSRWASLVVHTGPLGSGTQAKLARNLLHFIAFTAAGEAQRLAEAAGIRLSDLARIVRHSDAVTGGPGAIMLRDTAAPMAPDDDWYATLDHVRALGNKDLALALELGGELGVQLPLGRLALDRLGAELGL